MGVILGTLTTKTGQKIPLLSAADLVTLPEIESIRQKEERKYRRHNQIPNHVWGEGVAPSGEVVHYDRYRVLTEDLRRKGEWRMINYESMAYRLFEALFKTPNEWVNSRRLAEFTGANISSVSTLLSRTIPFLESEGLLKVKDDPHTSKGRLLMFVAKCEKPEEEAKLWYAKMLNGPKPGAKKKALVAAPSPSPAPVANVSIDTKTMEAVLRVPFSKLESVLRLLNS